jgi:hypothetical protein
VRIAPFFREAIQVISLRSGHCADSAARGGRCASEDLRWRVGLNAESRTAISYATLAT